ncbi:hypothetical protein LWI29_019962 [Acer saccharum]|uniref:Uncharacterized protein n=1 Tax=Acer saccharum TaxID=4024 RepID=A0AA39SWD7_ACESA|nr:hypothetical protein LWI29_019962 [Acer saccharum]
MYSANFSSPNETSLLAASSERQDLNDGEKAVPDLLASIQRHGVSFQQRRSRYHGGVVMIGNSGKWKPWMGLTRNDNGKGKSMKVSVQNEDKGKIIPFARTGDGGKRKSSSKALTVYKKQNKKGNTPDTEMRIINLGNIGRQDKTGDGRKRKSSSKAPAVYEEQVQQNPDRRIIRLGHFGRQPTDYMTPISFGNTTSKWVNFQPFEVAKQRSIFPSNNSRSSSAFHRYISKASKGPNSILGGFSRMDYGGFLRCYNAADPDDEWLIAQDGSQWKLPKWLKHCKISYYLPPYQVNFIKQLELRSAFGHGFRHSISSAFKPCVKRN